MSSELNFSAGALTAALVVKPSARARVMRLRVDPRTGSVLLTVPRGVSRRKAVEWAAGKREWVESVLAEVPQRVTIVPGSVVPLYDQPHIVAWDEARGRTVRLEELSLSVGGPSDTIEARVLRWLRQHARAVLTRETLEFADEAGVEVSRVGIGDPTSRWGSCSSSGAIRYSWRLILAPEWVRRATVAHEVAHRVHMNHSSSFHALVETLLGEDPKPARDWLKRRGAALHRFGRNC